MLYKLLEILAFVGVSCSAYRVSVQPRRVACTERVGRDAGQARSARCAIRRARRTARGVHVIGSAACDTRPCITLMWRACTRAHVTRACTYVRITRAYRRVTCRGWEGYPRAKRFGRLCVWFRL